MACDSRNALIAAVVAVAVAGISYGECRPVTILDQPGWCNWCPSPAHLPDGRVALAFSRWPTEFGFESWKSKSEIALAISKSGPLGPYEFVGTILPGSGVEGDFDRDVTHNPCLFVDDGKFYLYYMGTNSGDDHNRTSGIVGSDAWKYCGRHQQVGVAVADRVEGPYRRTGKPLFELSPDMVTLSNPAICRMPGGKYLMVVKWVESDGVPRDYPKCRVNHFAAVGDSPTGPFTIVNREVFSVPCANFPGEDPYLWTEGGVICCAIHDMGRFYSNEDRALIRFESKDGVNWTNKGVLFPRGAISRLERPAILCGADGSRLLFAAAKPDAHDPNSLIVAYPGVVPEPLREKEPGKPARLMSFNIWGDYFNNPPHEREDGIIAVIRRWKPDLLALQEVTDAWWNSKLFPELAKDGYDVVKGDEMSAFKAARATDLSVKRTRNHVPLLYRTDRYRLVESGFDVFHARLEWNKGVTWAVLEDRMSGKGIVAFATHFWWQSNGKESDAIREQNAELLLWRLKVLKAKYPYAVLGGGDLNSRPGSWAYDALMSAGYRTAAEVADKASALSTCHGDPKRDAGGRYRGTLRPKDNTPDTSIDHVFVETNAVHALEHVVVTDQDALDSSDHSPVVVDFIVRDR